MLETCRTCARHRSYSFFTCQFKG